MSPWHRRTGHRERSTPAALPAGMSLLRQMLVENPRLGTSGGLVPLLPDAPEVVATIPDRSAEAVWYGIEDL